MNSPTKGKIEKAIKIHRREWFAYVDIIYSAYLEAVEALRAAVKEEETMLDDHGFLDPEHEVALREQVKQHNATLGKAPEEQLK
jgi:hypothetical protein